MLFRSPLHGVSAGDAHSGLHDGHACSTLLANPLLDRGCVPTVVGCDEPVHHPRTPIHRDRTAFVDGGGEATTAHAQVMGRRTHVG